MSNHYIRKTPETAMEQLKVIREMLTKAHESFEFQCSGNLLLDIDHSISFAERSHKKPLISERMMSTMECIYKRFKALYDAQPDYIVSEHDSLEHNRKFAKEHNCTK